MYTKEEDFIRNTGNIPRHTTLDRFTRTNDSASSSSRLRLKRTKT